MSKIQNKPAKKNSLRRLVRAGILAAMATFTAGQVYAGPIAIVQGSFYTPNLFNNLTAAGKSVVQITNYTAASLAGFDAVVHYGNSFVDMAALQTYVTGGGRLVQTPWFWLNFSPPAALQVFSNGGGTSFSESYPGVNVLAPGDDLLNGVVIPGGVGGFNIGRTTGNSFVAGVTPIANWLDGTAFIGRKALGAGDIVGINMHVITSDTAFQVIDQAWATQLFVNAVMPNQVPEPATLTLFGLGLLGLGVARRRKKRAA